MNVEASIKNTADASRYKKLCEQCIKKRKKKKNFQRILLTQNMCAQVEFNSNSEKN